MGMEELKKTPLYGNHLKYGGRIIDFAGWALPVQFRSIIEEHHQVRKAAGLFDVSDMGELDIRGPQALDLLQYALTNDMSTVAVNQVRYSPMCNHRGGVVDDLLVYRLGEDHYFLVINAANIEKDYNWVKELAGRFPGAKVENVSDKVAELALQGPNSEAILSRLTRADLSAIHYYWCAQDVEVAGVKCMVSRTGYTGEDGFEIFCSPEEAPGLWDTLLEEGDELGLWPCGLGCRDTLRFEAAMPLYGQEMDDDTTPLEAGLGKYVKFDKGDFVGREPLLEEKRTGLRKKLVGLEMVGRGIARTGYPVLKDGEKVGYVTTGSYAPTLDKNLALAFVPPQLAEVGTGLQVEIRGRGVDARVVKTPFYRRRDK